MLRGQGQGSDARNGGRGFGEGWGRHCEACLDPHPCVVKVNCASLGVVKVDCASLGVVNVDRTSLGCDSGYQCRGLSDHSKPCFSFHFLTLPPRKTIFSLCVESCVHITQLSHVCL